MRRLLRARWLWAPGLALVLAGCAAAVFSEAAGIDELALRSPSDGGSAQGPIEVRFDLEISYNDTATVTVGEVGTLPGSWARGEFSGGGALTFHPGGDSRSLDLFLSAQVRESSGLPSTRRVELTIDWVAEPQVRYWTTSVAGRNGLLEDNDAGAEIPVSGWVTFEAEPRRGELSEVVLTLDGSDLLRATEPPWSVRWPSHAEPPGTAAVEMSVTTVEGGATSLAWTTVHDNCLLPDPAFDVKIVANGPDAWLDLAWDGAGSAYVLWDDDVGGGVSAQTLERVLSTWFGGEAIDFLEVAAGDAPGVWLLTTHFSGDGRWLGFLVEQESTVARVERHVVLGDDVRDIAVGEADRLYFVDGTGDDVGLWALVDDTPVRVDAEPLGASARLLAVRGGQAWVATDTELLRLALDGDGSEASRQAAALPFAPGTRIEAFGDGWVGLYDGQATRWDLDFTSPTAVDLADTAPSALVPSRRVPGCEVLYAVEDGVVVPLDLRP